MKLQQQQLDENCVDIRFLRICYLSIYENVAINKSDRSSLIDE